MSVPEAAIAAAAKVGEHHAGVFQVGHCADHHHEDSFECVAEMMLEAAAPIIKTEALTLDELDWVVRYLMRAELKEGLLLADMLNQKFGASARRRGSAWPNG